MKWTDFKEREENFTKEDSSGMLNLVWWLKGYYDGVKSSGLICPFKENHITAVIKAGVILEKQTEEIITMGE